MKQSLQFLQMLSLVSLSDQCYHELNRRSNLDKNHSEIGKLFTASVSTKFHGAISIAIDPGISSLDTRCTLNN